MGDSAGFRRPLVSEEGPEQQRGPDVEQGILSELPHQDDSQSVSPAVKLVGLHHTTSTAYFVLGFFFLPFVWLINFSMFRPYVYNPEAVATLEEQIDIAQKATTIRRRRQGGSAPASHTAGPNEAQQASAHALLGRLSDNQCNSFANCPCLCCTLLPAGAPIAGATMSITGAWVMTVFLAVWAVTFQVCARWYPTNWTKALTMTCPSAISHLG
eukprot:GHVU01104985.1.p1 GENE.GHVU01104985.1~~GHVU01104985.1.p1  ORF type:complete len:213 (+),score=7.77 GHVU01104985.1:124-762(+)